MDLPERPEDPPQVLLVIASLPLRMTVRQCIDALPAGCRCTECASGEEAERVGHSQRFDLAVIDLHLPGISAFDAARRLKALQPSCRIVLLAEAFESAWLSFDPEHGASGSICKEQLHEEIELLLPMYLDRGLDAGRGGCRSG